MLVKGATGGKSLSSVQLQAMARVNIDILGILAHGLKYYVKYMVDYVVQASMRKECAVNIVFLAARILVQFTNKT